MQYFKKELWRAFNTGDETDETDYSRASEEWDENYKAYIVQRDTFINKLSENASRFFTKVSLHDGTLLSFSVGDRLDFASNLKHSKRNVKVKMQVESSDNAIYMLSYSGILRCVFDFPSGSPLFYESGDPIDYWGYDEITEVRDNVFQHEILFASGATICIVFKKFTYRRLLPGRKIAVSNGSTWKRMQIM